MKSIFIGSVVITIAAFAIWFSVPFLWAELYENETLVILGWRGHGSIVTSDFPTPVIVFACYGVASVGLLFFKAWARISYLLLTIATIVLMPLYGVHIQTPIEVFFGNLFLFGNGVVLALAYLTSIGNEFQETT